MNTKEILTIIALSALGLCILGILVKTLVKTDKSRQYCNYMCGILFFLAVVTLCVSQIIVETFDPKHNPGDLCDTRVGYSPRCHTCPYGCKREGLNDVCCGKEEGCGLGGGGGDSQKDGLCDSDHCVGDACNDCPLGCTRVGFPSVDYCCSKADTEDKDKKCGEFNSEKGSCPYCNSSTNTNTNTNTRTNTRTITGTNTSTRNMWYYRFFNNSV